MLIRINWCTLLRDLTHFDLCRLVPVLDQLNAAVHAFTGPLSICQYWPITVMLAGKLFIWFLSLEKLRSEELFWWVFLFTPIYGTSINERFMKMKQSDLPCRLAQSLHHLNQRNGSFACHGMVWYWYWSYVWGAAWPNQKIVDYVAVFSKFAMSLLCQSIHKKHWWIKCSWKCNHLMK